MSAVVLAVIGAHFAVTFLHNGERAGRDGDGLARRTVDVEWNESPPERP